MSDSQWQVVCDATDVKPNLGARALIDNEQVAIFRIQGQLYAISNMCPFSNAAILSRGIVGDLQGQVVVASPLYKQHFNLETGACLEDANVAVKTYAVREQGGRIEVAAA